MLLYFEGFDMHQLIQTGLDVGAGSMQDAGYYLRGGTITRYQFLAGHVAGRAIRISSGGINQAQGYDLPAYRGRVGMWAYMNSASATSNKFLVFARSGFEVAFQVVSNQVRLLIDNVVITTTSLSPSANFEYYEAHVNAVSGVYQLSRNGITLINVTNGPTISTGTPLSVHFGSAQLATAPDLRIDHLWITDGDFPEGTGILGVQVVAAIDRQDGNDGFRGTIMVLGNRYQSSGRSAVVSSTAAYASGQNLTNVINFLFSTNPATNTPWTTAAFSTVDQWGLCFVQFGSEVDEVRVAGIHLAYLDYNNGRPLVRYYQAGASTSFSGPWRKSDPSKSYAAHIRATPRQFVSLAADADALFIAGEGCILFNSSSEDPEPILDEIGITFAEEFREDYKDWVRVLGTGVSFDSMFVSGYSVFGEGDKKFQDNYVTVNYDNVPTGSCYIQGLWDYAENADTGRWSMRQSIENKGGDYRHAHRRLKIRGHGKAMSLRVTNKGDTPFVINGWSMMITSNTSV